jgi:hypothetical protein
MNKERIFLEIDEIYSEWNGGDLHIGKERENLIKEVIERAINYTRCCESDSELLPTKQYEIEFSNHLRCGINVTNNEINVIGAIDGYT